MNEDSSVRYQQQEQYLNGSKVWGVVAIALVLGSAGACLVYFGPLRLLPVIDFVLIAVALAFSMFYTPDYLHLTVDPEKRRRWQIKIRWRIIGAVVVLGLMAMPGVRGVLILLVVTAWLIAANLFAVRVPRDYVNVYYWISDSIPLFLLLLSGALNILLGAILFAAAAHLSVVISKRRPLTWASSTCFIGCLLLFQAWRRSAAESSSFFFSAAALLLVCSLLTAFPVRRAQKHHESNVQTAMRELMDFTGYAPQRIRQLWSASNEELARNWQTAGLDEGDAAGLADWYRKNSQLYMFAISAYNLEYKRIRSNLKVLGLARGACLDYGAGNGEILLELARRGHRVVYYDVEGESMKFARQRAESQGLAMEFFHSKERLAAWARQSGGFDTVFSFDVLEHLPDLPGELSFLSSLLNSGGLFAFDVPAGSTKAHPMHLNHDLNVASYMVSRNLKQERRIIQRLTFRKEEKYFFRAS
jgi:2-polyprenyl-3-methyl-5-hydroxy-6-metoxy-1,4-benzoquinol methylase